MGQIEFTLDKQWDELPSKVVFCRNCVVSNQRPRTSFNEDGVCSACQWSFEKDYAVDWDERGRELQALCDAHRSRDGSFDVVVPGSGGKDSAYVAHQLRSRYGMNPLCVTWSPFEWTEIGWRNLQNFVSSGFTNLICQPSGTLHRKLARLALELKGDAWEPFAYGQKAWAFHVAEKFGIKLIFYGENGELEYGGSEKYKFAPKEAPEDWTRHYYKGASVDELVRVGVERGIISKKEASEESLRLYKAPPPDRIESREIEMHWFSYYHRWTPQENFYYAVKHAGFETNPNGRSEGTYTKYVSLDDKADGFHWYLKYMKFGMGRASRDAQSDVRRHHITREEAVLLVRRYDHEFPVRYFPWFLDYLSISEEFFWDVMNFYRSKSNVWVSNGGRWELREVVS